MELVAIIIKTSDKTLSFVLLPLLKRGSKFNF